MASNPLSLNTLAAEYNIMQYGLGELEVGDVIDGSTFDAYGTGQLEFYRMSDGEFFMRFSPEGA